jgi:hypothetical protein
MTGVARKPSAHPGNSSTTAPWSAGERLGRGELNIGLGRDVSSAWPFLRWGNAACEECGKQARTEEEARGWRAYLTVVEEDEPEEVAVYCPDCARREFEGRRSLT